MNEQQTSKEKLYAERDIIEQGQVYCDHVNAMTAEGLHAKSDIAAELAHRDIEIARLKRELEVLGDHAEDLCMSARATHEPGTAPHLVPGVMRCAKCSFRLVRTNLHVPSGGFSAGDNKTEPCPNGCGPLWPETWEQRAREAEQLAGPMCAECQRLREGLQLIAKDEHRLMNVTARNIAQSILDGKPSCGCRETYPQLQPGRVNHGNGCPLASAQPPGADAYCIASKARCCIEMLEQHLSSGRNMTPLELKALRVLHDERTLLEEACRLLSKYGQSIDPETRAFLPRVPWCVDCNAKHVPDCEVHHHRMADGHCSCSRPTKGAG